MSSLPTYTHESTVGEHSPSGRGQHGGSTSHLQGPQRNPLVLTTPVKSSTTTRRINRDIAEHAIIVDEEMRSCYTELPVDDWLSTWMPGEEPLIPVQHVPGEPKKRYDFSHLTFEPGNDDENMSKITEESELYPHMCEVIQNIFDLAAVEKQNQLYDKLVIMDTSSWPEKRDDKRRPDNSIYKKSDADNLAVNNHIGHPFFSTCVAGLEIKVNKRRDPWSRKLESGKFVFPAHRQAREDRAQVCKYVMEIEGRQHRRFTFMIFVLNNTARFFIFDRAAGVTSASFDYVKDPKPLQKFLYRLAISDDHARGYDPTITTPQPTDIDKLRVALANLPDSRYHQTVRDIISDSLDVQRRLGDLVWPLYEVKIFDESNHDGYLETNGRPKAYRFLIGRPVTPSPSLFGRATKGFVAFDPIRDRFVFLKDSWRSDASRPEWEIYCGLIAAGVHHIPTLICGGDVRVSAELVTAAQRIRTQTLSPGWLSNAKFHTRTVVEEIGQPLATFERTLDLVTAIAYALTAHIMAWKRTGTLHRDISDNNILLIYEINEHKAGDLVARGMLIDWDLSKHQEQLAAEKASDTNRSGTWAFMSAVRQRYPKKPYELSDDIESFIHVLIYCAARYLDNTLAEDRDAFAMFIKDMYTTCSQSSDGTYYGCRRKWDVIKSGQLPFELVAEPTYQVLLNKLLAICRHHYNNLDLQGLARFLPSDQLPVAKAQSSPKSTSVRVSELEIEDIEYSPPVEVFESSQTIPGLSRKPLDDHKVIYDVLRAFVTSQDDWPKTRPSLDHFSTTKNVVFTEGKTVVTETESSQRKRQRPPTVTDSKGWKRKFGTSRTSSTYTSESGYSDTHVDVCQPSTGLSIVVNEAEESDLEEVERMLNVTSEHDLAEE